MKLHAVGGGAVDEGLIGKGVAAREQGCTGGQVEALAVKLVHLLRPVGHRVAGVGGVDRVVAPLDQTVRMLVDGGAEMKRQHLRTEADSEEGRLLLEGHLEPVDLSLDEVVRVVGAHASAKDHYAGVIPQSLGQRFADTRAPDLDRMAARANALPDPAGVGFLPVRNEQDWLQGSGHIRGK